MLSGISIAASLSIMAGATFAFFTSQANSTGNTFSAGTLEVNVLDQNADSAFANEVLATNWVPGEEAFVNFDVKNDGSIPMNFSGFATGTWGDVGLDGQNMVKVVNVERWDGASWVSIISDTNGITGVIYYTNDGTNTGLPFDIAPGSRAQLRLTVEFDEDAGDDFQDGVFTSTIQVNAKQTNAPW